VLKITTSESPTEMRWILHGRLVGPWIGELRTNWKRQIVNRKGRACVVDLNDVTYVDKRGERLLRAMSKEGAQFIANGLYIKHVLEGLKMYGNCGLPGIIASLFVGLLLSVICFDPSTRLQREIEKTGARNITLRHRLTPVNAVHLPNSVTLRFKRNDDQDYASRIPRQGR